MPALPGPRTRHCAVALCSLLLGSATLGQPMASADGRSTGTRPASSSTPYVPPARCEAASTARGRGEWVRASIPVAAGQSVPVAYYLPAGLADGHSYPLVMALHGWDHTPRHVEVSSNLAGLPDAVRAVVVVPDMGRSVYERAFYGRHARWGPAPGAAFIGETAMTWARQHLPVRREPSLTALIGYSTGGRGAFVVAQQYPGRVGFVGSI